MWMCATFFLLGILAGQLGQWAATHLRVRRLEAVPQHPSLPPSGGGTNRRGVPLSRK